MATEFTCAVCGGTFDQGRSEEETNAEAEALFGVAQASTRADMAVVCDDCWQRHKSEWIGAGGIKAGKLRGRC